MYTSQYNYTKDTGRRVLRRPDDPNLSKSLSLRLVSRNVYRQSTTTGTPSVDCRPYFVDTLLVEELVEIYTTPTPKGWRKAEKIICIV